MTKRLPCLQVIPTRGHNVVMSFIWKWTIWSAFDCSGFSVARRLIARACLGFGLIGGSISLLSAAAEISSTPLMFEKSETVGFEVKLASETGLSFSNRLSEQDAARNRVLLNGSGLALGDYDGDGYVDIYLCGLNSDNVLYRNLGNWKFVDVTSAAGLACSGLFCRGAVMADLNGDRALDMLVSTVGQGTKMFVNRGGTFIDETVKAGLKSGYGASSMTVADVDGDGNLDVYVANYRSDDIRDSGRVNLESRQGRMAVPEALKERLFLDGGQLNEFGEPDQLFLSTGKGQFREQAWQSGRFLDSEGKALTGKLLDWGLSASFRDVNGDMLPDLYVCNDYWSPDRFWINQGKGVFQGVSNEDWRTMSASSMGVDFSDIDRDGDLDFFVVDMLSRDLSLRKRQREAQGFKTVNPSGVLDRPQAMRNTLAMNRGDGSYVERAYDAGLEASDWSWCPLFVDVDLDGFDDLLISAGHAWDVQDLDAGLKISRRQHSWSHIKDPRALKEAFSREMLLHNRIYPKLEMPVVAYRNQGTGRFVEATEDWGLDVPGIRHGMGTADLDNDGDLDLVANRLNGPLSVFENVGGRDRVMVSLSDAEGNTQAVGAKVRFESNGEVIQESEIVVGGRYLSGSDTRVVFGLNGAASSRRLVIRWRNGGETILSGIEPNHHYQVHHPQEPATRNAAESKLAVSRLESLFVDISDQLGHRHQDPDYDDFARQPLLPHRLSQAGPGAALLDLNLDGHLDLTVGGGQGQGLSVYLGNGLGAWQSVPTGKSGFPSDMAGIVGWWRSDGGTSLVVANTGYERLAKSAGMSFEFRSEKFNQPLRFGEQMSSAGALSLGDLKGNGTLAMFVSGGVLPGQYPRGGPSKVLVMQNGKWVLDAGNSIVLSDVGLVNGATWSDLTGDGFPELILACEWSAIRVFRNERGQLFDVTNEMGLAGLAGLWRGVSTVDLNGDGAMDIVATNWGSNSEWLADDERSLVIYHGEVARPGVRDIIETAFDPARAYEVPTRQLLPLAMSLPFLSQTFSSHRDFSEASLRQVMGPRYPLLSKLEAVTLKSTIFFNEGATFRAVPMPDEAQWAPASGIVGGDFNGDGTEDLMLAQNFFTTRPGVSRLGEGRGLLLLGDGAGGLIPLSANESGLRILGDQRAVVSGDFDEDGRLDLVVTQNRGQTKVYKNAGARRGVRLRLIGPPGNPTGLGASIRVANGTSLGPARMIHGGDGYLSQSSAVTVLTGIGSEASVWVQWPGGRISNVRIPDSATSMSVDYSSQAR